MREYEVNGLYEEVVSDKLDKFLQSIGVAEKFLEGIEPEEAPEILAQYASKIIKRRLQAIAEKSDEENKLSEQITLVNKLISDLAYEDDLFQDERVSSEGELLRALLTNDPLTKISNKKASDIPRPETSIAASSLFTCGQREPGLAVELKKEIASADRIDLMVSFIRWSGVRLLFDELKAFTESGKKLRIITTTYMGATELKAVQKLAALNNTEIKVSYDGERTRLHAKVYIFHRNSGYSTAYVGSSNMTAPAMTSGCEWNVKVTKTDLPDVFDKIDASYEGYWNAKDYEFYTEDKYDVLKEALERAGKKSTDSPVRRNYYLDVYPYQYQQEILDELDAERTIHNSYRNLICAATGTGKTIIAALDYRRLCEREGRRLKLLFIAHRKEILDQSLECFREVVKDGEFGDVFYNGKEPSQSNYLFASISMINSRGVENLPADKYDYIVFDECHHTAAESYQRALEYFKPKYLVGLTATPERMDEANILPYFGGRIAAEIRLPDAIDRKLLCPFQYFGVADSVDLSELKWSRGGYDVSELEKAYVEHKELADKRTRLILQAIDKYISDINAVKGLVFCVSKKHASYMADKFVEAGIPTLALTSDATQEERNAARLKLQSGEIKFICSVDLYNEGVDIKQINTVLFLRPTESMTVFLQQLGRGLRLAPEKECLTVLDFIGQANKNYALFETKFGALQSGTNIGTMPELKQGFPHLPRGCFIKLEKKAQEYILNNIKAALRGRRGIEKKLCEYELTTGKEFSFFDFLNYYHLEPQKVYTHKITATQVRKSYEDCKGVDPDLAKKKMFRLTALDSVPLLNYMIANFRKALTLTFETLTTEELYYWKMMHATFIDKEPKSDDEVRGNLEEYWKQNEVMIDEVVDVLRYNLQHVNVVANPSELDYFCVLQGHCTYTRAQALAAFDFWRTSSEGVTRISNKKTTCLFVTLNKGASKFYTPSIAYRDYSINEFLFHWQSQNSTAPETTVGQRYIKHDELGENILLFVREHKESKLGPTPFMYLGKVRMKEYSGSKPMSIVWELNYPTPAKFLTLTDKLGVV